MTELAQSYRWCRRVCRLSKSSFFASFSLLDPVRRNSMYALYAFARISDDLSDSSQPLSERTAALQQWSDLVRQLGSQRSVTALPEYAPLWPALSDSLHRFDIPLGLLEDVVKGVTMDLHPKQPDDWPELRDYCYHVASAVGIACTYIWRRSDEIPTQSAIDCGVAFQLTNILRDLAEDASMGRIYLPKSLFEKHGIRQDDWLSGHPSGHWRALLSEVASEAQQLYASGWQTIHSLTPRSQRMFSLIWRSYRSLLDEVTRRQDRLWQGDRVRLSSYCKTTLMVTHFVSPLYARLPQPC